MLINNTKSLLDQLKMAISIMTTTQKYFKLCNLILKHKIYNQFKNLQIDIHLGTTRQNF